MATIQTPNGVTLRVSAKTGLRGLSERTQRIIAGMAQAAPSAGIAVIDITAGKEGGHLSHANGTEVDLKAYSADGSLWTTQQRVALAAGAQAGGADRFGLYSFGKGKLGSGTMHVGYSGPGRPPAVWGADSKVRGDASRRFTDPAEKAFLAAYQAGQPFDIASLGLTPLGPASAPQDAQSAIASLIAPSGGPAVPDMPTAAMGYAPNLPGGEPPAPAMPQVASAAPPMPTPPPSWAQGGGFPIDEALTGQSADSVLMGGPRMDPRRAGPATGMIAPEMGSMQSPEDVLAAGPRLRPGGAPDASMVPDPLSRLASGVTPPPPQSVAMRNPPMRPGGAPDAGMVPTPPPRAQGIPNPPPRGTPYAPAFPSLYGEQPGPPMAMASRTGDMSAAMGNAPPAFSPPTPAVTDPFKQSFDLANDMNTTRENTEWWTGDLRPQSSPPPMPAEARTKDDAFSPPQGPFFDSANPGLSLPPSWASGSFPAPPSPVGTVGAGSTGGEFFTPAMPMPQAPSDPLASRFDDAFAPGGGGQIMDLQSAFNNRNAPPTMNAQGGINEVFGAPPAPAAPPNLAIPFAEVPGFDPGRFAGSAPASAATIASPLPMPAMSRPDFDARFAGGSVVQPQVPTPGVTPGVVQGTMPMPGAMDIRSPAQAGGSTSAPPPLPKAPPSPRQTDTGAQRQKQGGFGRVLGGLLGGPLGALGGGLLGGGGIFGNGGSSVFSPMGSAFSAPYMQPNGQMGQTNVQHVQSGSMNGTMWNRSNGGSVGYVTDPFTGAMIYSASPTAF